MVFSELALLWNRPCYVLTPRPISHVIVTQVFCATARNLSKVQCVHFLIFICFTCIAHDLHKPLVLDFPQQLIASAMKQNKIPWAEKLGKNTPGALAAPSLSCTRSWQLPGVLSHVLCWPLLSPSLISFLQVRQRDLKDELTETINFYLVLSHNVADSWSFLYLDPKPLRSYKISKLWLEMLLRVSWKAQK